MKDACAHEFGDAGLTDVAEVLHAVRRCLLCSHEQVRPVFPDPDQTWRNHGGAGA